MHSEEFRMKTRSGWWRTIRGTAFSLTTLATLAVLAGNALAQPPGGGRGFGGGFGGGGFGGGGFGGGGRGGAGGALQLLTQEAVQKELGLTPETIEKGRKLVDEVRSANQAEMASLFGEGGFQNMSDEQRRELPAKMAAMATAMQAKYAPKAKELLTPEQFTRLQQIGWQVAGVNALQDAELAKQLGLSAEQTAKIAANNRDFQAKQQSLMRELFAGRGPGGAPGGAPGGGQGGGQGGGRAGGEGFAKIQELNKEREAAALEVLTADQKANFEKLKGKPFDVASLQMGRGPGGPGGRGGQGGPGGRPGAGGRPGRPAAEEKK
jgi:hypothetical protein